MVTQTEPGDLFIIRNAGNICPAYGSHHSGEAATIEYAVSVLEVNDIVICGHSHCGAMNGLLNPASLESLPTVRAWLTHAESTRQLVEQNHSHANDPEARLMAAVETNVLVQLENLRTHPCVTAALDRDELKVHGWVYRFETGQVLAYTPSEDRFLPLEDVQTRAAIVS